MPANGRRGSRGSRRARKRSWTRSGRSRRTARTSAWRRRSPGPARWPRRSRVTPAISTRRGAGCVSCRAGRRRRASCPRPRLRRSRGWTARTRRWKLSPMRTRRRPERSRDSAPAAARPSPPPSPPICGGAPPAPRGLARRLAGLSRLASRLVEETDFTFLFDPERKLFSIGYNLSDGRLDPGYYDLLASEARLASFIAIARGDVPASHWFRLGRSLTPVGKGSALISWSGSMFEYLMPALVMKEPAGSLLEQTNRLVVERQIRYGEERGVPWGVSESAFNAQDLHFTYQYSNFGVSGLGLEARPVRGSRRGPVRDRARGHGGSRRRRPQPAAPGRGRRAGALRVLRRRRLHGLEAARRREERDRASRHGASPGDDGRGPRQRSTRGVMRERFHAEPAVQATELLLQERTPSTVAVARPRADEVSSPAARARLRRAGAAALPLSARSDAPRASALQRPLLRHDHGGGLRFLPLAGARRDALARGRHAGLLGNVHLPAGRRERPRLVGRLSARRRGGGRLRGLLLRGPRRDPATGRAP